MDAYEATRIVFSRIQSLDPENASKIMGLLLIQDHGEKEMIRLAFGPEALVHSIVLKARKDLGLSSSSNSNNNNSNNSVNITNITSLSVPSTPSTPFFSNPISRQNSSSSRMLTNLSPSSSSSPSWVPSNFSDLQHFDDLISPNPTSSSASYAAAVAAINGFNNGNSGNTTAVNNNSGLVGNSSDLIDDFQLQDQLSFLNEAASPTIGPKNSDLFYPPPEPVSSPGSNSDGMLFPSYASNWGACAINNGSHRRSSSVTDICMGADPLGSGLGWKPCLYFARGYCKNGTSCRFLHGLPDSAADAGALVGSPNKFDAIEQCQELLLRSKTQQQQQQQVQQQQQQQPQLRLSTASQLMASASFPYSAAAAGKCMNFLLQQQQNDTQWAAAAALMLGDDMHKFGRPRIERNDFSSSGGGMVNPGSRQIYLTFPADSTFREEDVSNYFSIYGPVQDVRIPYQQKRMFGFVTFVYPETVKLILAKGNPHFVCDARVLVKPYKEKGKVPDKYRKQQQQQQPADRGDFSACTTPTGIDSRDSYDLQLGGRTFNNTQDFLRRKLEEQADLQQAIELQSRRFLGLQLLDVKKHQRNLSTGAISIPSPTQLPFSPHFNSHASTIFPSSFTDPDRASPETPQDHQQQQQEALNMNKNQEEFDQSENGKGNGNGNGEENEKSGSIDDCGGSAGGFHSSLEHNLPDSPFASPKKSNGEPPSISNTVVAEIERSNSTVSSASLSSSSTSFLPSSSSSNKNLVASSLLPATSTLDMASFKSCLLQVPRFPSGHGALGM